MPCNSLHLFTKEIRAAVSIKFLSLIEETTRHLRQQNFQSVGILASQTTRASSLYQDQLKQAGIEAILPSQPTQEEVGSIIHRLVTGKKKYTDLNLLSQIIENLEQKGAQSVALTCTDLPLLLPSHPTIEIIDTMDILVKIAVETLVTVN